MRISVVRAAFVLTAVMLTVLLALPGKVAAVQVGDQAPDFSSRPQREGCSSSAIFEANRWCWSSSTMPIGARREWPT